MKQLNLIFMITTIVLITVACSSPKEIQSSVTEEPTNTAYTSDNTTSIEPTKTTPEVIEKPETKIHIVKKGENLWDIARKYGTTVKTIAEANNIEDTSLIKINQELVIPQGNRN